MATPEEIEDLHAKLEEVLGIDNALTLMRLLLWNRWEIDYDPEAHTLLSRKRAGSEEQEHSGEEVRNRR